MKKYGRRVPIKNPGKIHGSDCDVCCPEDNCKSRERRKAKKEVQKELSEILESE